MAQEIDTNAPYNIVTADGEVKWGPYDTELEAHNKLKSLLDHAIEDECDGMHVE